MVNESSSSPVIRNLCVCSWFLSHTLAIPQGGRSGSSPLGAALQSAEEVRKAMMDELVSKVGGRATDVPKQAVKRIIRTVW